MVWNTLEDILLTFLMFSGTSTCYPPGRRMWSSNSRKDSCWWTSVMHYWDQTRGPGLASYANLNLHYPSRWKKSLVFIQKFLLNLEDGTKTPMAVLKTIKKVKEYKNNS